MSVYVVGHRSARRRAGRAAVIVLIVLLLLVAGAFAAKHFLSSDTTISDTPPATTSTVKAPSTNKKHINQQSFSMDLPADWQPTSPPDQPYTIYSWHNTTQNKGVRQLNVYVDGAPQLAVNRVLPVQANGAELSAAGDVSGNCVDFTPNAKNSRASGSMAAKWQDVKFLCDTANYVRDVVGTSSHDGIDTVKLSGASGQHSFFFTYTDNSAVPDYNIFIDALNSFQAK